ncbi:MAG: hypothetical protein ACRECV_13265 [Xanthobacteraceae bacterium]
MRAWQRDYRLYAAAVALCALALGSCATTSPSVETPAPAPAAAPAIPSSIRPEEVIGRWGYGSYHRPEDLVRTEAAARVACSEPVVINRGPTGGVMMYLADNAELQELQLKGSPTGQNYIGPPGPPGGMEDRQIVSFDGRTMVLKWMNPEVAGRYGIGVYVRCAPEGTARPVRRPPPRPAQ